MKQILVPFLAALAASAGDAQMITPPGHRLSELRLAVLQSQSSANQLKFAAPRQLTAAELAELRRQVQQQSHKPARS